VHVWVFPGASAIGALRRGVSGIGLRESDHGTDQPRCVPLRNLLGASPAGHCVPNHGSGEVQTGYRAFGAGGDYSLFPAYLDGDSEDVAGGTAIFRHIHRRGSGLLHLHVRQGQQGAVSDRHWSHEGSHPEREIPGRPVCPDLGVHREHGLPAATLHIADHAGDLLGGVPVPTKCAPESLLLHGFGWESRSRWRGDRGQVLLFQCLPPALVPPRLLLLQPSGATVESVVGTGHLWTNSSELGFSSFGFALLIP